jgi:SSS family solute:Na+ symporter
MNRIGCTAAGTIVIVLAVFLMGLFWKKSTNNAAIWGIILSIPIAMYLKIGPNGWSDNSIFITLPFLQQMMATCILTLIIIFGISHIELKDKNDTKGIVLTSKLFETKTAFNISAVVICVILVVLYVLFW